MGKKYSLITGASSGIGKSTAELFASKGKNLILIARGTEALEEVREEIKTKYPNLDIVIRDYDLTDIAGLNDLYDSFNGYDIETWINNAGFGILELVKDHSIDRVLNMIRLNVEALTVLSIRYVQDYANVDGTQLINISSGAGYILAPMATAYAGTKFYVSAFTEGLDLELKATGAKMRAKVLAPASTKTNFANVATNRTDVTYGEDSQYFKKFNTSEDVAGFLYDLYQSDKFLGLVDHETFTLALEDGKFDNLY
ncbi:SDR family NAD(P)-dependent oxidoreductase [Streptococcus ratti]|uniref:SDR family NAD(P)-dependent oxidoreductase n=1 Tax=Streptococcus ratti TaxID=1341 RepID=A0A7X9LF37_STRRT|nr:SDR family NAD(P)-dependent oxidoreductase [Streptococcus ratti]NMD49702.1 SDR family NAD(P)-dependent oxidoreductase [Streptococcus ratti]